MAKYPYMTMDALMEEVKGKLNEANASYIDRCIEYLAYQRLRPF